MGALIFAAPLLIVLVSAIQPNMDLMTRGPAALPEHFTLGNFSSAWTQADLAQFYRNSLLILVVKVPLGILLTSLAAYPIATMRFRSRKTIFVLVLIGLGVPQVITLYPLLLMVSHIGLGGSVWSLLLPYLAFGTPLEILVIRGAFASIHARAPGGGSCGRRFGPLRLGTYLHAHGCPRYCLARHTGRCGDVERVRHRAGTAHE